MIKGALFDMDGVLVNNLGYHMLAYEELCKRYGIDCNKEQFDAMNGMGVADILQATFPQSIIDSNGIKALTDEKEAIYRELYKPHATPVKGLVELLEQLHAEGIRCAVGTSGSKENLEMVLDSCRLRHYFDALVNGDMVSHCKPDPEIYLTAAAAIQLPPQVCVVFDDAVAGIQAGQNAGAKVVGVATTYSKEFICSRITPDMTIYDFTEITPSKLQLL